MLDVRKHRLDYGAMLIPPSGYRLAKAVAATYSLDLNTLLSIPVALFFSQTLEGNFDAERIQILESIQRCPNVLRVYHQVGKIHVPKKHNRLYGLLEPCMVGILPDNAYTAFHPKVWVLRYEHEDLPIKYRVIVLSRNLTYDRNWDVAAHLDGEVTDSKQEKNVPLVDFVKYLTTYEGFEGDKKFIADLRTVDFQAPNGFHKSFFFHPIGIDDYKNPIITQTGSRAICVSPFLHEDAIRTINENVSQGLLLFGRSEELRKIPSDGLEMCRRYCISRLIVDGESNQLAEDGDGYETDQNLHAKLYVYQSDNSNVTWFLGSANATKAAFQRNVEFLLELRGTSSAVQLDRLRMELLGAEEQRGIFEEFDPTNDFVDESEILILEQKLRLLEFSLLKHLVIQKAEVKLSENQSNYDLHLVLDASSCSWDDLVVKVMPFNSVGIEATQIEPLSVTNLCFQNINESNLSKFLQLEIWQDSDRLRAFLLKVDIDGIPDSRVGCILRSIINSRDKFFEYLRFILADDLEKQPIGTEPIDNHDDTNGEASNIWEMSTPIFEQLLLSASRSPLRLKSIDDAIQLLRKEEHDDTDRIIPNEFLEFWEAFKKIVPQQSRKRK